MIINLKQNILEPWLKAFLFLGVFFILVGLHILQKVSHYQTFFYILIILPVTLLAITDTRKTIESISTLAKIFIIFAVWSSITILWSDTYESILTPIKRSIYILSLFIAFSIVNRDSKYNILKILIASGLIISSLSIYSLYNFQINYATTPRLIGPGALSNPLLSSHIYGIFSILFIALSITAKDLKIKSIYLFSACILVITVVATGSRTPLLALAASTVWISLLLSNRKSLILIIFSVVVLILIYFIYPDAIFKRGLSQLPELWFSAIEKILINPILGYGFDSSTAFYSETLNINYREPHNMHLSILYFTGIIGFSLWCVMHLYALWICWANKTDTLFIIASALLVYGIIAGMTEGGGLLPRPKEHWFITWIPLAFVSSLITNKTLKTKEIVVEHT